MRIDLRSDLKPLTKRLSAVQKKQVPFATALTLTNVVKLAQAAEVEALPSIFDRPTPFTLKSIGVKGATKTTLTAAVFAKDIAAAYLEPFEFGGPHALGTKKGLLGPVNQGLNQYGNIPRSTLARLKAKPNVFVGTVRFRKSGQSVSGVWQRPAYGDRYRTYGRNKAYARLTGEKGTKGNTQNVIGGVRTGLKLLIRFEDPKPVRQHLRFRERADKTIRPALKPEFRKAMAKAMATAK